MFHTVFIGLISSRSPRAHNGKTSSPSQSTNNGSNQPLAQTNGLRSILRFCFFSFSFSQLLRSFRPKGLGTSTDADARDYFSHMEKHMIPFAPTQEGDRDLIELAFSKKKADDRKEWLRGFTPGTFLDHRLEEIPYSEFINKELILFSMADNIRSIPSFVDGLKPGQRKVIWACFKRKLKSEVKVCILS